MKKISIKTKNILFDGIQKDIYEKNFKIETEHKDITFRVEDFSKNNLSTINNNFSIEKLISNGNYTKVDEEYLTEDDLMLYYFQNDNYLFIISYGEFQPSRFILKIESVWDIN